MQRREQEVQRAIILYLEAVVPDVIVFAIPNAATRERGRRAGNAVPGLKPGMPDLGIIHRGITYYIEVKAPGGKLKPVQADCLIELAGAGAFAAPAENIEQVRFLLDIWGIATREAKAA